jgi:hypothetical protein
MKERIKWILVGLGFTFGLQVLVSLIFFGIAESVRSSAETTGTAPPMDTYTVASLGLVLGAFVIGGFVIGWMSEELRVVDALLAATLTIALIWLVYIVLPSGRQGQFASSLLLDTGARAALFIPMSLVAAAVGAYWGWHVGVPHEGVLDRVALLLGLIGVVVGPFALIAFGSEDQRLPLPFLIGVLVLVLAVIGVGFWMFTRETRDAEEISISPDAHGRREEL